MFASSRARFFCVSMFVSVEETQANKKILFFASLANFFARGERPQNRRVEQTRIRILNPSTPAGPSQLHELAIRDPCPHAPISALQISKKKGVLRLPYMYHIIQLFHFPTPCFLPTLSHWQPPCYLGHCVVTYPKVFLYLYTMHPTHIHQQ